jgi:hypothetical protein
MSESKIIVIIIIIIIYLFIYFSLQPFVGLGLLQRPVLAPLFSSCRDPISYNPSIHLILGPPFFFLPSSFTSVTEIHPFFVLGEFEHAIKTSVYGSCLIPLTLV